MAECEPCWDDAVARLAGVDQRQHRTIIARAVGNAAAYRDSVRVAGPIERRRIAGLAARDALAAYLLEGGTPDHFTRLAGLLDVTQDGPRAAGALADRAAAARRVLDAHTGPDRDQRTVDAAHAYAAALEQPHRVARPESNAERPAVLPCHLPDCHHAHADTDT